MSGKSIDEDITLESSLRPRRLLDYVGQEKVKDNLQISISAAKKRHESFFKDNNLDVEAYIIENFDSGEIPDIALMPNPQGVTNLGERSIAIPINNFVNEDYIKSIYPQHLIDITTSMQTNTNYGAWLRLFPNSLVWYNIDKYEKVGFPVFSSYKEMLEFTTQIAGKGSEPWCLDIESGVATGWIATNWVEDILLNNYGPEVYDQWWKLEIQASSNTMVCRCKA